VSAGAGSAGSQLAVCSATGASVAGSQLVSFSEGLAGFGVAVAAAAIKRVRSSASSSPREGSGGSHEASPFPARSDTSP
jgi:hypothetical protein